MIETVRNETGTSQEIPTHPEIDGVAVDADLLERLRSGLAAALARQHAHCAALDFDVPLDSARAVLLTEGQERDDDR